MYALTDVELIARHHQTERRNEAASARRSRFRPAYFLIPRKSGRHHQ